MGNVACVIYTVCLLTYCKPFQMWFSVQLCRSWQDFNWHSTSRGPSATAEPLVLDVWQVFGGFPFPISILLTILPLSSSPTVVHPSVFGPTGWFFLQIAKIRFYWIFGRCCHVLSPSIQPFRLLYLPSHAGVGGYNNNACKTVFPCICRESFHKTP